MKRCGWAAAGGESEGVYHDTEWGVPVSDDRTLYEFLVLEGAQAGLSWRTILDKRAGYAAAFAGFDPVEVAGFDTARTDALMLDTGIVRNRLKILSTVTNARAVLELQTTNGSFSNYLWDFVDGEPVRNRWRTPSEVPATSALSDRLSKDMKRRGFKFVGSTIMYSFMQATGMINDHLVSCFRHAPVAAMKRPKPTKAKRRRAAS
ncbi:MAG: DNA-3-methyladenine glycosylase I [Pseudomonadota bacterium]